MFTSRLPIQRANDVHQGRIIVRLTVADSEDARLNDYVRLRRPLLRRHLGVRARPVHRSRARRSSAAPLEAGYRPRSLEVGRALARGPGATSCSVVAAAPRLRRDRRPCRAR